MIRILFSAVCLLAITNCEAQHTLVPETLWKLGRVADPQVSPDGDKVLYMVQNYSLEQNKGNADIWICDIATGNSMKLAADESNESMPRWSPDGKSVYYLNDAGGSSQLWMVNPDGTGKIQKSHLNADINLYAIAPSGDRIWYVQDVAIDKILGKDIYPDLPKTTGHLYDDLMARHWNAWADGTYSHLFVANFDHGAITNPVDVMVGEPFDCPLKPDGGEEEIAFSPDGKTIVYTCKKYKGKEYALNTNSDLYLYDVAGGKTTNITSGMYGYDRDPVFSPDGKMIAWLSQQQAGAESDRQRIYTYEILTGKKNDLTKNFDNMVEAISFNGSGNRLYFRAEIQGTKPIFFMDMNDPGNPPNRQLTSDIADFTGFSVVTPKGKTDVMIASRQSLSEPTELFKIDMQTGKSTQLTYTNKAVLSDIKMGEVRKRMVKTTDGKEMLTWVVYPPDFDPSKKYPTLLYCQGGPQTMLSQFFSYRWNLQLMAANGYIVVAPNRRGLPGFGSEWNDRISNDWGGQPMKDLLSAIDDVSLEPYVDKDHRGAVGASFGGYSTFWLEGHHQKRFKAFISHCGVFNFEGMMATEELFFQNHEFGGPYWQVPKPESYELFSPNKEIQSWDTPILIISNERDYRIPYSQGLEAFTAARLKNIPAKFLSFPDEGHWVLKPQNSVFWQRTFFDFLDTYLKK